MTTHACFHGDNNGPGPLQLHTIWTRNEYQNAFRDLVLDVAKYYANKHEERKEQCGSDAVYTECEKLGKKIVRQRREVLQNTKEKKAKQEADKKRKFIEDEESEDHLGFVSPGKGVQAPSGVELDKHTLEGLAALALGVGCIGW